MGWVVQSHGALYAAEYGFDASFEALVAEIAAKFIWPRSMPRANAAGSPRSTARRSARCFWCRQSDEVAKLRLLLVDPAGRGQGLGHRLVDECIGFARHCGYRRITLWTQSILIAARKIYQDAGLRAGRHRAASQFRPGPDRRDLGAESCEAACVATRSRRVTPELIDFHKANARRAAQ